MEKVAEGFKGEKAIVTPYNIRNLQRENNITKQLFVSHIGYYPRAQFHFRERERMRMFLYIVKKDVAGLLIMVKSIFYIKTRLLYYLPMKSMHMVLMRLIHGAFIGYIFVVRV